MRETAGENSRMTQALFNLVLEGSSPIIAAYFCGEPVSIMRKPIETLGGRRWPAPGLRRKTGGIYQARLDEWLLMDPACQTPAEFEENPWKREFERGL